MDEASHRIGYDLEAPTPIMFWEPLEFSLSLTMISFGMVMNMFILGFAVACGILAGSRYLKRGAKKGAMQHYIWALGLNLDPALKKTFKPAYLNEFIE